MTDTMTFERFCELADAYGGTIARWPAGERASRLAVETVAESVLFAHRRDSQVLLAAVEEANRHWQRLKGVMTRGEEKQGWSIPWFSWSVLPNSRYPDYQMEGKVIDAWGRLVDNLYGRYA